MKFPIVRLGEHMPLSTRRVVAFCGRTTSADTAIGKVDGLADGVVLVRPTGSEFELTVEEADALATALRCASAGVKSWREHASGFNRVRVARAPGGVGYAVTWRGRARPMRLSTLRTRQRRCEACGVMTSVLYVAADVVREHGLRVRHCDVCMVCVEELADAPETIAAVVPMRSGPRR